MPYSIYISDAGFQRIFSFPNNEISHIIKAYSEVKDRDFSASTKLETILPKWNF